MIRKPVVQASCLPRSWGWRGMPALQFTSQIGLLYNCVTVAARNALCSCGARIEKDAQDTGTWGRAPSSFPLSASCASSWSILAGDCISKRTYSVRSYCTSTLSRPSYSSASLEKIGLVSGANGSLTSTSTF